MTLLKNKSLFESMPQDFQTAYQVIYEPNGWTIDNLTPETESKEYGAFDFEMNQRRIKFRVAKITPTKIGQFVTLWKRIGKGPILPYDLADPIDLFVISVSDTKQSGQFVFPKSVLFEKGILSKEGLGGKRAMRIYPSWDRAENKQAKQTQEWQLHYFFEITPTICTDQSRIQKLFFML